MVSGFSQLTGEYSVTVSSDEERYQETAGHLSISMGHVVAV
jgi:hypothetical protein